MFNFQLHTYGVVLNCRRLTRNSRQEYTFESVSVFEFSEIVLQKQQYNINIDIDTDICNAYISIEFIFYKKNETLSKI